MVNEKLLSQEFKNILDTAIAQGASDIHIMAGLPAMLRVDTLLRSLDMPPFSVEESVKIIIDLIGQESYERIHKHHQELDFSFSYQNLRFRCNAYYQKGTLAASLRLLPNQIKSMAELGVPQVAEGFLSHNQGLIIVTGPTGHGKSTTLAAMIDKISQQRRGHIITVEDPIEYLFENKKSIVSQREIGTDTFSFSYALRSALREDPDVVLVGEMRDVETMEAALQIAETGHLVLTSLHTNSAAQTANRIIDVFPTHKQDQVRIQLAEVLLGIISQRLLPRIQGGRVLAAEVLIANAAVRSLIREGKTHQIPNLIQTAAAEGMVSLDKSLAALVSSGDISVDEALAWSLDPKTLKMMIY